MQFGPTWRLHSFACADRGRRRPRGRVRGSRPLRHL